MAFDIFNITTLLLLFVSLLFAVFLVSVKSTRIISNYLLATYLLLSCIDFGGAFIFHFIFPKFPGFSMLLSSTVALLMPLLYLFILSVIYTDFRLKKVQLLHGLVFVAYNLIFIPNYYLQEKVDKLKFIGSPEFLSSSEVWVSYILLHIQEVVYLILCFYVILKYRKLLLENYASASTMNFRWLLTFISLVAIYTTLAIAKNLFLLGGFQNVYRFLLTLTSLTILMCLCWIVLRALQNPEFFRGVDSKLQLVRNIAQSDIDSKNNLEKVSIIKKLKAHMADRKPYLDDGLTLHQLAIQLNMDDHDLSVLINRVLNQHFFNFVNGYRIKHAMELLRDPDKKELTILEILYTVGFNSKSSFNTAFKKHVSQTPTEYRKSAALQ